MHFSPKLLSYSLSPCLLRPHQPLLPCTSLVECPSISPASQVDLNATVPWAHLQDICSTRSWCGAAWVRPCGTEASLSVLTIEKKKEEKKKKKDWVLGSEQLQAQSTLFHPIHTPRSYYPPLLTRWTNWKCCSPAQVFPFWVRSYTLLENYSCQHALQSFKMLSSFLTNRCHRWIWHIPQFWEVLGRVAEITLTFWIERQTNFTLLTGLRP